MSILFQKVKARTASALGVLEGADVATHEASYGAALSSSTIRGADWSSTEIQDAVVEAVMELASDLIEAEHSEADAFNVLSSATASGSAIPTTSSGSIPRIGRVRRIKDSTNARPLLQTSVDKVRDFINASSTVFNGYTGYFWAMDGSVLLHTRTNVICEFGGFTRATITVNIGASDVIPLTDRHESAIVAGAVCKLASKEGQYAELWAAGYKEYSEWRAMIRGLAATASQ